jgi:predicted membrane protein
MILSRMSTRALAVLLGLALCVGVVLSQPKEASASPSQPAAVEHVSTRAEWRDCANVAAAIGGTLPGWAIAAVFAPYCGSWLGAQNARNICWQSRQWWGYSARSFIWAATWGHYTRC